MEIPEMKQAFISHICDLSCPLQVAPKSQDRSYSDITELLRRSLINLSTLLSICIKMLVGADFLFPLYLILRLPNRCCRFCHF